MATSTATPLAIVTPPIRTPLTPPEAVNPARPQDRRITDIESRLNDLLATRDWWLYWNSLTNGVNQSLAQIADLQESLADEIRSGTHAERLATPAADSQAGALWMETDRNNIVYQVQLVNDAPTWVYVTGAMYGTVIAVDQRPTGLGVNDTGLIFLSSDSTSVRWNGGNWEALGRILDLGPAPTVSQLVAKANGAGALSFTNLDADNAVMGFGVEWQGSQWIARDDTCAWLAKQAGQFFIYRSSGNTVGAPAATTNVVVVDLATGYVGIGNLPAPASELDVRGTLTFSTIDPGVNYRIFREVATGYLEFQGSQVGFSGYKFLINSAAAVFEILNSGGIRINGLPGSNPGVGSKQLWYDPATFNVKYSP